MYMLSINDLNNQYAIFFLYIFDPIKRNHIKKMFDLSPCNNFSPVYAKGNENEKKLYILYICNICCGIKTRNEKKSDDIEIFKFKYYILSY